MAMFKAFKPSGMEKIARSMGYQGNMQGFQDYLAQDPMRQQQMQNYQQQAVQMAKGGAVPPRRTDIKGQNHMLAYITPQEGELLKAYGGSGKPGPMGIPAFEKDDDAPYSNPNVYDGDGPGESGTFTTPAAPPQYQPPPPSIPPAQITTMAVGEEGEPMPDFGFAPGGDFIAKTMAVGEDEPQPIRPPLGTTRALGEDFNPTAPNFTTQLVGEDNPNFTGNLVTAALGEDGNPPLPKTVTEAIGEDDPNFNPPIGTLAVGEDAGPQPLPQPVTINGITYNSATRAVGETMQPPPIPGGYGPTAGGQQQPVPIATPPQPTVYDPLGQYRPNVDMYSETGAFKNPQIQSSHETLKEVYEKTDATAQEKNNATLDYLRNIYTGPIYNSEAGATGFGSNRFTQEFAQFANAMGIEIDNSFAATDGPQLVNIPEGNPTLIQAGWMPQAPIEQPGIGQFSVNQLYAPGLPPGGATVAAKTNVEPGQFLQPGTGQVSGDVAVPTATAATSTADPIQSKDANTMSAVQAAPAVDNALNATAAAQADPSNPNAQVTAAQQTASSVGNLQAAQGNATLINNPVQRQIQSGEIITGTGVDAQAAAQLTAQTQAAAATANPSQQATVQGQLDSLTANFSGTNPPPWAAGALRSATAQMAARGLGASSLSGQAIIQATMEAAMPIAMADAQTFATFEAQNLSNRQQSAMMAAEQRAKFMGQEFDQAFQRKVMNASKISDIANLNFTAEQQVQLENSRAANTMNLANLSNAQALVMAEAAALAQLDTSNLNNRQQAAVQNAQNFLQYDMANLSNRQQTELFKSQQRVQALFTDQAATNAARQFNATSQNQTDQFFANLASQTSQFNAIQQNAQAQFNAGQTNTVNRFNAELNNQRDQFNATNQLVIAQSNAQWRRQIATADTAAINRANELNANAVLDISKNAYDNLWNYYSDTMEWAWKSAESELDRLNALATAQLSADAQAAAAAAAKSSAAGSAIGNLIGTIGSAWLKFGGCWVALEVYSAKDVRWFVFRSWLHTEAPEWFRNLYQKHGEDFAKYIKDKPAIKWIIRQMMNVIVNKKMKKRTSYAIS